MTIIDPEEALRKVEFIIVGPLYDFWNDVV